MTAREEIAIARANALVSALIQHERQEGEAVQYRATSGSWVDVVSDVLDLIETMKGNKP